MNLKAQPCPCVVSFIVIANLPAAQARNAFSQLHGEKIKDAQRISQTSSAQLRETSDRQQTKIIICVCCVNKISF